LDHSKLLRYHYLDPTERQDQEKVTPVIPRQTKPESPFLEELAIRESYFVLLDNGDCGGISLEKCDIFRIQKRLEFDSKSPFITVLVVYS
jgi:hypothetical protein